MQSRQQRISLSITRAILSSPGGTANSSFLGLLLRSLLALFRLLSLPLQRLHPRLFHELRTYVWQITEDEYLSSFAAAHASASQRIGSNAQDNKSGGGGGLQPAGDLGYSGSVFFSTPDSKFLVKSLNRKFEYEHWEKDMLDPYAEHMRANSKTSLLVRIVDYLAAWPHDWSLGILLGLTPQRYLVMENVLGGQEGDPVRKGEWETWDLKPADYFYPERDIADGALAPESVKARLTDTFADKMVVTPQQAADLRATLRQDTALLEAMNCVDYSLFLVRFPGDLERSEPVKSKRSAWREGVLSADSKYRYRLVLLDFFWAKHKLQPRLMTALIDTFNVFARKGPMSITTTPKEYRERFLRMVDALLEEREETLEGS
jgi:hypothetical protein